MWNRCPTRRRKPSRESLYGRTHGEGGIDLDRIYLRYNRISPDQADRWRAGFTKSAASLSSLPNRCPIVRDSDRFQGITVRQLLFGNYRILFHVIELAEEETEGVVRVMRVLHSAQMLDSGEQIEDD